MTNDEIIKVITAAKEGKKIQSRTSSNERWKDKREPIIKSNERNTDAVRSKLSVRGRDRMFVLFGSRNDRGTEVEKDSTRD